LYQEFVPVFYGSKFFGHFLHFYQIFQPFFGQVLYLNPVKDHGIEEVISEQTTTETHLVVPPIANHFSMSIELLSLRLTNITKCGIYLKYCYPFFGSSKPIYSGPPVPINHKNQEIKFEEPFCQFDFACLKTALETQFRNIPLLIEIWTRSGNGKILAHKNYVKNYVEKKLKL